MSIARWTRSLFATALVSACQGTPADDTDTGATEPGTTTSPTSPTASSDPTSDPTSTATANPTSSTTSDSNPTSSTDPSTATTTATDPTGDLTDTGDDTTGGTPGLACPLAEQAGVEALALAPALFADDADPSASPSCAINNPERGFHDYSDLRSLDADTLEDALAEGMTVLYGQVLIPEYRNKPLDAVVLAEVAAGFDLVRAHGMKVVPRFHYSNDADEPDAALDRILGHIEQLAPLLQEHADVILTLQAGFIGAWGEWHSSQNGLDAPGPRKQVMDALLAALPANRTITVRRPSFKQDAYGGPVTQATAHDGSPLARVGHVNDCFLASDDDFGTYQEPGEKDYAIADGPFVPVGGETCAVNPPRSSCPSALDELALHRWTHLNARYHPDVLDDWQADGCYAEIACRLGYRLAVTDLRWAADAAPGQSLPVSLDLVNDGYAAPVNARPVVLVLAGPEVVTTPLDFDLRTAQPGEKQTLCADLQLPVDLPAGSYRIGLAMADPAPTLASDPRQAIQLANEDIEWSEGTNWFDAYVVVN